MFSLQPTIILFVCSLLKLRHSFKSQFWCSISSMLVRLHFLSLPAFSFLVLFPPVSLSLSQCLESTECSFFSFCPLLRLIFSSSQLLPSNSSTASCFQTAQSSPHLCEGARLCPHQAHKSAICPWHRYRDRRRCFILSEASKQLSVHSPFTLPFSLSLHVLFFSSFPQLPGRVNGGLLGLRPL